MLTCVLIFDILVSHIGDAARTGNKLVPIGSLQLCVIFVQSNLFASS